MDYCSTVSVIWLIFVLCTDISDLQPFVQCSLNFANLTEEIEDGAWVCVGSCKKNPNFCNQRGECLNEINGPLCM